jgi:hypothetical protein
MLARREGLMPKPRTTARIVACAVSSIGAFVAAGCGSGGGAGPGDGGSSPDATAPDGAAPDGGGPDGGTADVVACQVLASVAGDASGVVTCADGGVDAGGAAACGFSVCLGGGLTYDFGPQASCGAIGLNELWWDDKNPTDLQTAIAFNFSTNLTADQLGPLPLTTVEIKKGLGPDGGVSAWMTPAGACSATITSSTCAPEFGLPHWRVVTGTGTCTQPAAPEPGTSAAPIDIGHFVFSGGFEPP